MTELADFSPFLRFVPQQGLALRDDRTQNPLKPTYRIDLQSAKVYMIE
jgi:hypothetical protein